MQIGAQTAKSDQNRVEVMGQLRMGASPLSRNNASSNTRMLLKGADKMTNDEITIHLAEMALKQSQSEVEIWKNLNELQSEIVIQGEVIQALAAHVPDLNRVMERLLSRKDELLAQATPRNAKLYAEQLERWHTHLLYAQRIVGNGGA
jgi:hypothetical protein